MIAAQRNFAVPILCVIIGTAGPDSLYFLPESTRMGSGVAVTRTALKLTANVINVDTLETISTIAGNKILTNEDNGRARIASSVLLANLRF